MNQIDWGVAMVTLATPIELQNRSGTLPCVKTQPSGTARRTDEQARLQIIQENLKIEIKASKKEIVSHLIQQKVN